MSEWSGKSKGSPLGYKIFIFILRYLNIRISYFFLWFVAFYFYCFTNKKAIKDFYRIVKHYKGLKLEKTVFLNFYTFGKIILDRISILAGYNSKFTFNFEGEEHLHAMAKSGKGGIILGAHAGNWEVAGKLLQRINCRVNIVMYDGESLNIKKLLEEATGGKAFNVIFIKPNDLSHIYEINQALQNGELIAMHGDRFVEGSKIIECDFFNKKAPFPLGPYYLAATANVPICFVSTMKESATHYHFYSTKPVNVISGNKNRKEWNKEVYKTVTEYSKNLEEIVKQYPLQWFNYYNFWDNKSLD